MGTYAQAAALGSVQEKTRSIAAEVWTQCKMAGAVSHTIHGYRAGTGEHSTGMALDFMVAKPYHDAGQAIRDYIWRHRVRHDLKWVIWEQHVTTINSGGVPRLMEDRGSITQNHFDHPHGYWEPGSYVPKPLMYPVRTLSRGAEGGDVALLQRGLNAVFDFAGNNLSTDGKFGPATEAHVKAYQLLKKLADDGKVGPITRRSLTYTAGISL